MNENFINNYEYYKNISLQKYNTYRLAVKCGYLIYPKDVEELIKLLKYLKENNISYFILGSGSNIILAKPYFEVVIKLDRLNKIEINDNTVIAEAGTSLIYLANICMNNNLNGLAFAGGIPGSVGASTSMNAGAYKEDMSLIVKEVKVINPELNIITLTNSELNYSYRSSFLKENKDYICIETTFEMKYLEKEKIKEIMDSRKQRRIDSQPLDKPSAGSVFRNPEGLSAGKLIEEEELREQIKGAGIGTSATRAEIMKKLERIGYIAINSKTQIITPTQKGEAVFDVVNMSMPDMLNPKLTASWEKGLDMVAKKEIKPDEFMTKLEKYINSVEENFVIGGAIIYRQLMTKVDKMYITRIHEKFEGDAYFPVINEEEWNETEKIQGIKDEKNTYDYEFLTYVRK